MPIEFVNIETRNDSYLSNSMIDGKNSPIIRSDESRIMQVLLGLLSNALKFTVQGSVKVIARIIKDQESHSSPRYDEKLEISVEDTGIGISKDN